MSTDKGYDRDSVQAKVACKDSYAVILGKRHPVKGSSTV